MNKYQYENKFILLYYMGFDELTKSLIEDIKKLNTFAKDNKIDNEIKIDSILDKIIKQEKEYALLKHNLENSKNNLETNIKLLEKKCNMEYKIYETLFEHKKKLNELKKKHNEESLPEFDGFTKNLFNIEPIVKNEKHKFNPQIEQKNPEQKRLSGNVLQEQLNAAIVARRSAVDGDD